MSRGRKEKDNDEEQKEQHQGAKERNDCSNNFPGTIWAFTFDLSGARIDQDAINLVLKTIGAEPDGQQNVFEGDVRIPGGHRLDLLHVAANVLTDAGYYSCLHDFFGFFKTLLQGNTITFRAEPAQ